MATLSVSYTNSSGRSGTATVNYTLQNTSNTQTVLTTTSSAESNFTGAELARLLIDGGQAGAFFETFNYNKSYTRTAAAQTHTIEIQWITYVNGTYSVKATKSAKFTVPALPSYTIAYSANGGSSAPASQTKYYGIALTLTSTKPTRTGYTFSKWNTASNGSGTSYNAGASYTANAAATLYAVWTANTWYVKYNGNGATSGSMSNSTHTYNTAKNLTANAFTRAYTVTYNHNYSGSSNATATATYTFSKWNTASNGTGTDYANQASVKNLTSTAGGTVNLYARWTSASVSLRTPTRTGYTFGGWYKEAACTNKVGNAGASYTPTANITLYAKWTANTYTISFNANGGSGAPASQTKTYNQALTLSSTKPTRADCKFLGWATSSTATTATYQPGGTLPASVNTATTLYAVWESIPKITSLTAVRCDSEGTQDDEGTYAKVTAVWSVNSAVNSATSATAKLYNGTTEVTSGKTGTWSGSSGGTATAIVSGMSVDNQYTFKFEVTNGGSKASRTVLLTRAFFTMDFKEGGNGVGIFSAAPSDGLIVGKPTAIYGNTSVRGTLAAYASNIDRDGTLPSSTTYSPEKIIMRDVDGEPLFYMDSSQLSSGTIQARIVIDNKYDGTAHSSSLYMTKPKTSIANDGTMTWLGNVFAIRSPYIDRDGAVPSETQYSPYIYFQDKDAETLGYLQAYREPSGVSGLRMYGSNEANGSQVNNGITLYVRADGTRGVTVTDAAAWRSALAAAGTGVSNVFSATQYAKFSNVDRDGTAPSSDAWCSPMDVRDKDNESVANFIAVQRANGRIDAGIVAFNEKSDGTEVTNNLYACVAKDGTLSYYITSPAAFRNAIGVGGLGSRVTKDQSTAVNMATSAYTNICSVSLSAGTWVIEANAQYANNATGRRIVLLTTTSAGSSATDLRQTSVSVNTNSTGGTYIHTGCTKVFTATTTLYLVGWQNSGGNLSVYGCITAVRII